MNKYQTALDYRKEEYEKLMSKDIKACPFCGSEACLTCNTIYGFQIFCTNDECFMNEVIITGMRSEERAIQAWNKRIGENKK